MAIPQRRSSIWPRLAAVALSAGIAYLAFQCFTAGFAAQDYGLSLFGLTFLAMAGVALNLGTRGLD